MGHRGVLVALGFLVSAPAVLVSSRAQLLSHPPERGPDVIRQYELVPDNVAFTVRHVQVEGVRSERYLDLWQIRAIRLADGEGLAIAIVVSGGLVALGALAAVRLRRSVSAGAQAEGAAHVSRTMPSPGEDEHPEGGQDREDRENHLVEEGALACDSGQEQGDREEGQEHPGMLRYVGPLRGDRMSEPMKAA
jgi:hypothetical protein